MLFAWGNVGGRVNAQPGVFRPVPRQRGGTSTRRLFSTPLGFRQSAVAAAVFCEYYVTLRVARVALERVDADVYRAAQSQPLKNDKRDKREPVGTLASV